MKKYMSLMLGLAFLTATVAVAQEPAPATEKKEAPKKATKKAKKAPKKAAEKTEAPAQK